jgi:hypothetical protein
MIRFIRVRRLHLRHLRPHLRVSAFICDFNYLRPSVSSAAQRSASICGSIICVTLAGRNAAIRLGDLIPVTSVRFQVPETCLTPET